jgi:hypothetical protein
MLIIVFPGVYCKSLLSLVQQKLTNCHRALDSYEIFAAAVFWFVPRNLLAHGKYVCITIINCNEERGVSYFPNLFVCIENSTAA